MGNTVDVNITTDAEHGYTEEELYATLSTGFICIFENLDVTKSFAVDQEARAAAKRLGDLLVENSKEGKLGGVFEGLKEKLHSLVNDDDTERQVEERVEKEKERLSLKGYGREMVERFVEAGKKIGWSTERVIWEQMFVFSLLVSHFTHSFHLHCLIPIPSSPPLRSLANAPSPVSQLRQR